MIGAYKKPNMKKTTYRQEFLAICTVSVLLAGCGTSNPFESVPVSGKVTYEDGSPAPVSKMFFKCLEAPKDGMYPRLASVPVQSDGTFENVTTYKFGDGLVIGKHKVSLVGDSKQNSKGIYYLDQYAARHRSDGVRSGLGY